MMLLVALVISALALYKLYKYIIGPSYHPGQVHTQAKRRPDQFDDAALLEETTESQWSMPDGMHLYHTVTESREPAQIDVLCVSGGPGIASRRPWAVCEESCKTSAIRYHSYHARGTGKSSLPFDRLGGPHLPRALRKLDGALGLFQQVSDIERIRRRLRLQTISLIGHSFGALLATLYAAEFPHRVRSLVLVSPANLLCLPVDDQDMFEMIRSRLQCASHVAEFNRAVKKLFDFPGLMTETEATMQARQMRIFDFYAMVDPLARATTERLGDALGGWTAFASMLSLGMQFDYRKELTRRLRQATFRTLIVTGSEDMQGTRVAHKYEQLFPNGCVQCKVMATGHFAQEDMAAELAKEMRDTILL